MDRIKPGKFWYDNNRKRIQAHGSSIIYADGVFYWYGENKEGVFGRACPDNIEPAIWHNGVKVYSSKDLYNWVDEGVVIISDDPKNPFYPRNIMDRPHILYHDKTKKFIMWAKCAIRGETFGGHDTARYYIATSDKMTGPFMYSHEIKDVHAGDFDLFVEDGKGYYIGTEGSIVYARELTDDFMNFTDKYSTHLEQERPPFVREAPCYFVHDNRKFIITSGTTGYFPNPTVTHEIHDIHGEYIEIGKTCVGDYEGTSFRAQFSSVFKHPLKKDLYIALGDRWLNDLPYKMDITCEEMFDGYYRKEGPWFRRDLMSLYSDENTSEATYVWLPIRFDEEGNPYIEWLDEWKVEDFE